MSLKGSKRKQDSEKRYSLNETMNFKYLKYTDRYIFACNLEDALREAAQRNFVLPLVEADAEELSEEESSTTKEELFPDSSEESFLSSESESEIDLRTCDTRTYIENTVGTVVLLALATLERERPEEPIDFLAEFLLHYKNDMDEEERRKLQLIDPNDPLRYYKELKKAAKVQAETCPN